MSEPGGAAPATPRPPGTPRAQYPLTPLQQGMLFHALLEPHSGVDVQQIVCSVFEEVDVAALERAWRFVAATHAVLATSFRWENVERPTQEVWDSVSFSLRYEDWRVLDCAQQQSKLEAFLPADRRAGFELDAAPLFRIALFRTAAAAYEFVWTVHHAIVDGRSFVHVLRDVFACYETLLRGARPVLARARPFRDFVAWLEQRNEDGGATFWRRRLRGFGAATALPWGSVARRGGIAKSGVQRHHEAALARETTASLASFASEHGVTLNTLVQGAWAILLARHGGEWDVVFGATRAGRRSTVDGADASVGPFIHTLPVRTSVLPAQPLVPWLRQLRADWAEMREWEHTPLARVQAGSDVPPGLPLFESIVVFEHRSLEASLRALGGAWSGRRVRVFGQTNYPLSLEAYGDAELRLKLQFDASRFADADIARVLSALTTLLAAMPGSTLERPIADLPWLTAAERDLVIDRYNRTVSSYPRDASVPEIFALQVAARPAAVALVDGERRISYRELDERANQLARRLRRLGGGADAPVGLCLERSADAVIGALAILKAGGAYVPLDPAYPAERLRFMVEDTGLSVVLTLERFVSALPPGLRAIRLDSDEISIATESTVAPHCAAGAESTAYIMYTSGSSGVPKGVAVTHRGIARLVVRATYAHFGTDEVLLGFAPLTFDASTFEIWGALLNGARLAVFADAAPAPALEDLGAAIRTHGVTTLWLTAALFGHMVERDIAALRPLRQLLVGGDVLSVSHVRRALEQLPGCRLINAYGPTENTTFTTTFSIPPDWNPDGAESSVPIGRPIDNTTVYVLDEALEPVPIGVAGRLYAGGDGVARGYHGRSDLTAERFIADPFAARSGGRLYDTGDRARRRTDGTLEFLGRADRQLKIRGFRIEPGEVEAALAGHASVGGALVVASGDAAAGKRLVAYVVPCAGRSVDPPALAAHLAARLPAYMLPAAIVALAAFPLTPNGKIERAALPGPDAAAPALRPEYVAPRTDGERALAEIWASVLCAARVSVADNFFELGGDSILAIALVSRAREAGFRITPRQLYDRPTVAELAAVAQTHASAAESNGAAVQPDDAPLGTVPLTPIQRWFFETESGGLNHWNQAFLFSVPADLESARLACALGAVLGHHDALQLRFGRVGGAWQQRCAGRSSAVPFEYVDLAGVARDALEAAIAATCAGAQASLDIASGPIVRVLHLSLGSDRPGRLFVAVHHLAVDGVSWRLLLEDLEAAYDSLGACRTPELAARTTSFRRWAERLTQFAASGGFEPQRAYWHGVVAEPAGALPRDFAGSLQDLERDSATVRVGLDAAETRALLKHVPAPYRTRVNDVLLAALASALRSWVGNGSLLIDLEGHGREDELFGDVDLSRTVGWFTSIFPVRLDLRERSPRDALRAAKERLREIPQRGVGYAALKYVARDATLGAARPSELVFNYLGQFDRAVAGSRLFAFAPEDSGAWREPSARRRYAIELNGLILNGRLELRWSFNRLIHARETIERVAAAFLGALRELIEHCTSSGAHGYTPSDFPLAKVTQAALDAVTADSRDVEDLYPLAPIQTLFQLFAGQATDPGFEQWRYRLRGPVDAAALRSAWQAVVARHPILRTAFVHEGLEEPLQLVRRKVELPWDERDLRALSGGEQTRALTAFVAADRARGFAFEQAPLMRLALLRLGDAEYEFVWSHHHLLLDRWSFPIVLEEVEALYRGACEGSAPALPPALPYSDYVRFLQSQDERAAENFWRSSFEGLEPPGGFARRPAATDGRAETSAEVRREEARHGELRYDEVRHDMSLAETQALRAFARTGHLSANVVVLGAWALCLSAETGRSDLLLGLAVSGRPADLAGVERLVGVTINNVPLRARIARGERVLPWLRELAARQLDVQLFGFAPPLLIQRWSGLPWRKRLFESMIVFQHASADARTHDWLGPAVRIEQTDTPTQTGYPLALSVAGDARLSLRITCDRRYFSAETAGDMLERLRLLLVEMIRPEERTLETLLATLPAGLSGTKRAAEADAAGGLTTDTRIFVPPSSPTEAVIARIWSELLGVPCVGAADNFFALGGQSLLAMQAVVRVRETFSVELPVRALFKNPTVAEFARELVALERTPGGTERVARLVQRVDVMSPEELSASDRSVRAQPASASAHPERRSHAD